MLERSAGASRDREPPARTAGNLACRTPAPTDECRCQPDRIAQQLAAARARKASLDEILRERAYAAGTIQKLLGLNGDGEKHGFHTSGLLSDFAEVEPRYEAAVEQFLREELDFVVVESFDCARAGVNLLRSQLGGAPRFSWIR